jgi:2-polyprenyl-3-methyl-5-hydroxy-6-metoxy-1,4-benzoquinol methylase
VKNYDEEQKIQEDLYDFPYHHIPSYVKGNFSAIRTHRGAHEYLAYLHFIISQIKKIEFSNLLDIGCGDGKLLYEISKEIASKNYVGIDYSERAILFAKAMSPHIKFVSGDITMMNLGKFDVITLIETLEHIPPNLVSDFIKSIYNHIASNGTLLITVPSVNVPKSPKHYQHFDLQNLQNTLNPFFTITEHNFITKGTTSARLIKSLLANRFFALNHQPTLNKLFRYYIKNSFYGNGQNSTRIFALCKANDVN